MAVLNAFLGLLCLPAPFGICTRSCDVSSGHSPIKLAASQGYVGIRSQNDQRHQRMVSDTLRRGSVSVCSLEKHGYSGRGAFVLPATLC